MTPRPPKLLLYSRLAFYPVHREAFICLGEQYHVTPLVIADTPPPLPDVHRSIGSADPALLQIRGVPPALAYQPPGPPRQQAQWLHAQLRRLQPDAIWVQEEPTSHALFYILRHYWLDRRPRIVTAVCENIFGRGSAPRQMLKRLLWSRLDGLLAVATASAEGIQAVGLPRRVPVHTLVAGALPPPPQVSALPLPFDRAPGDFIVGYAGRIVPEKGWPVLLTALEHLPPHFKLLLAGSGSDEAALHGWMQRPALAGRVFYLGLLPRDDLWRFYAALDAFVLPSLTTPRWKEQFGAVLADSMALGVPVIGSDSGAIPEVVGPAGLITPEG
nr:glycosyltransferase [Anaerolineae bacterium]